MNKRAVKTTDKEVAAVSCIPRNGQCGAAAIKEEVFFDVQRLINILIRIAHVDVLITTRKHEKQDMHRYYNGDKYFIAIACVGPYLGINVQ